MEQKINFLYHHNNSTEIYKHHCVCTCVIDPQDIFFERRSYFASGGGGVTLQTQWEEEGPFTKEAL